VKQIPVRKKGKEQRMNENPEDPGYLGKTSGGRKQNEDEGVPCYFWVMLFVLIGFLISGGGG